MIVYPTQENYQEAIHKLQKGELIGLPTETVYGLAGDATSDLAIARIFEAKKRPTFNPLIIHGSSQETFKDHVVWNDIAEILSRAFWPGPLTLVLPRVPTSRISLLASAGLESLAIRVPHHPVALDLLTKFKGLLAAPSANPSGRISSTQAIHVQEDFSELFILDGGNTTIGLESTIIDLTTAIPLLLRHGGLPVEEIESLIGSLEAPCKSPIKAPGMLKSHYAPSLPLRLNVKQPLENEAYLAFGHTTFKGDHILNLSPSGHLTEAAANLFKMMRLLDNTQFCGISVAPIPLKGLGMALNDRLLRAAAPREL
ncbi:MAG: threonylcarbamoyl-AMP synthase [Alphaproteobacteria bacterium]|nr:threonylcarbamoyl-AMP synthase [Alphaproteobacteria bacterium]